MMAFIEGQAVIDSGLVYLYFGVWVFAVFSAMGFALALAVGAHDLFLWLAKRRAERSKP